MRLRRLALPVLFGALFLSAAPPQKKKKEDPTQTLQLPKELPSAVVGETRRLTFLVTPLSAKGLLTPQIREALKALTHQAGGDTILKIRAFVAGSGDVRRVRDLVSDYFSDHRQPLPAISLIRSGGLPMEGAQVVLEAIAQARKDINPSGLAFISAQPVTRGDPVDPPPAREALAAFAKSVTAAGADPDSVVRVTCFLSSLEGLASTREAVLSAYPHAAADFVQTQRAPGAALAACEGVARLSTEPARLTFTAASQPGESAAALVGARQVVLTGTQVSFGYQEQDARLAFERLRKEVEQAGANFGDIAYVHYYPLSNAIAAQLRKLRPDFFKSTPPPAATLLLFEGLPSMDAGFAIDAIAVK